MKKYLLSFIILFLLISCSNEGDNRLLGPILFETGIQLYAPVLVDPENNNSCFNSYLHFDWQDVANAEGYKIVIDDQPDFSSPLVEKTIESQSSYQPTVVFSRGIWYWKVRAYRGDSLWSEWSVVWKFNIISQ